MHNINELYSIRNKCGLYTKEAIRKMGLTIREHFDDKGEAYSLSYHSNNGECLVNQADGTKRMAYFIGEKQWTYDKAERDAVRAKNQKQKEYNAERKALLNQFEQMTNEQLAEILKNL